jgi:Helicase conserved C-terminal domain
MTTSEKIKNGTITDVDLQNPKLKELFSNVAILTEDFTDFSDPDGQTLFNTLVDEVEREMLVVSGQSSVVSEMPIDADFEKLKQVFSSLRKNDKGYYVPSSANDGAYLIKKAKLAGVDIEVLDYVNDGTDLYDIYVKLKSSAKNVDEFSNLVNVEDKKWKLLENPILSSSILEETFGSRGFDSYSEKKVKEWDADDFVNYVKNYTNFEGVINNTIPVLSSIFQPHSVWVDEPSGFNNDKNFNKYLSAQSALYDIWIGVLTKSKRLLPETDSSLKTDIQDLKESVNALAEKIEAKPTSAEIAQVDPTPNTQNPIPDLTTTQLARLAKAIDTNDEPKSTKLTLSVQEVIEKYNAHISADEIKAWVWYKRTFGNPMNGWEKYYISNNKTGRSEIVVTAKETVVLLDNRWKEIRTVGAGTVIGRKTRFANEYQGINYVVVKSENEELLYVDDSKIKEEDQTFKTDAEELEKLVMAKALVPHNGEFLPIPVFQFGNMYEREAILDAEKDDIVSRYGLVYFNYYKELVNEAKPKMLRFEDVVKSNRPIITVLGSFANDIELMSLTELDETTGVKIERPNKARYSENNTPFTLREAFEMWFEAKVKDSDLKNTSKSNIKLYYLKAPRFSKAETPEQKAQQEEIKNYAREECEALFGEFLATALLPNDVFKLNVLWNKTYNHIGNVKGDRVPLAFTCSATFKNAPLVIKTVQRNAVGFLQVSNSGCLAHDVGYGKTLSASLNSAVVLSSGRAKRLLLGAPKPVVRNWRKELFGYWTDGDNVSFDPFKAPAKKPSQVKKSEDLKVAPAAYFVTGLLSNTEYTLNYWGALNKADLARLGDINKLVPEKSITLVSYQGLEKIGFSRATRDGIMNSLMDILSNGEVESKSSRDREQTYQKYREMMGEGNKNTVCDIDVCGFDYITVDEVHNFNHVFGSVGANDEGRALFGLKANPSTRGVKLFFLTNYIQRKYNGNVCFLSATPFTNNPLEIFSLMSMVGWESLRQYNLQNIRTFFETFIQETFEYAVDVKGQLTTKTVIKSYINKHILQKLLYNHFDYRSDPKEAGVIRPCLVDLPMTKELVDGKLIELPEDKAVSTILEMNEMQKAVQQMVRSIASDNSRDNPGAMFRAMAMSLDNAFSPFLAAKTMPLDHVDFVTKSPKIHFAMLCIESVKQYHEERGENVSGQVIYSDRGKELFGYIKEYLHDIVGFQREVMFGDEKVSEVEILDSSVNDDDKEIIKEGFLRGVVKVIIGTSTIKEGVNLQTKGTVFYDLYLNWNPTDRKQKSGRIHRQGNEFGYVRYVMPLVQNSMDAFIFQKLEEKQSRINDLWGRGGANVMEEEMIDPEEIKFALITDAKELTDMRLEKDKREVSNAIRLSEEKLSIYGSLKGHLFEFFQLKESIVETLKVNMAFYRQQVMVFKGFLDKAESDKENAETKRKIKHLGDRFGEIADQIDNFLADPRRDEQEIFEIMRNVGYVAGSYSNYFNEYQKDNKYFSFGYNVRDKFRAVYSIVKRAEKEILAVKGLSIYDDISSMKEELELELGKNTAYMLHLESDVYKQGVYDEIKKELDRRAAIRGDLYEQVEKFKSLNYLLSYKADNTDRESCTLPKVECCPTNGFVEPKVHSETTEAELEPVVITLDQYRKALKARMAYLEDLDPSDPKFDSYTKAVKATKLMVEMMEEEMSLEVA